VFLWPPKSNWLETSGVKLDILRVGFLPLNQLNIFFRFLLRVGCQLAVDRAASRGLFDFIRQALSA
jgi:hypothetical protein